jgi:fumarate hydratase class II
MVCAQVIGNDTAVAFAGAQGHFELNVFKPMMAYTTLQSLRLLADAMESFTEHCVVGLVPNEARIREHLRSSLMLVTALAPKIGYYKAAEVATKAHKEGTTLREAALALGATSADEFDSIIRPEEMCEPSE